MAEYDAGNFEISWHNLPDWFKRDVVGFLDFKSRLKVDDPGVVLLEVLRYILFPEETSAAARNFIEISWTAVHFSLRNLDFSCPSLEFPFISHTDYKTITKHSYSKNENTFTEVIQDFLRLFQNSKSIVNELTVDFSDLEKSKMVIDEIEKIAKENFKIRVKKIIWYSCPNNLSAVQFVNFITVGALETIRFEYQHGNLEMIKRLIETEQWKQAEEITTSTLVPKGLDIEKFSHVKRLKIKVEDSEWDVPKIQNLIMNFKRQNHPVGSFFSILVYFRPKGSEREEEEIPTPIIVDEVKILPKSGYYFRMPNKNHFLRVHRLENGIEGLVRDNNEYIEYFIL